ncbi:hypothetical protein BDP27DRAFT_1403892 [Rhodocollybia butyracea]|uniref:Uncharacterized protein n=1 Tax=Rhodocollybia butyracea TaxID=206335 RepID=A0A9P5PQ24_9AGAR|nr:hypothetical protein BDP27DRAFT_1403892 [Rhodocollybia butyracea]
MLSTASNMAGSFSFFDIRKLQSRATRPYDPLSHPADLVLFMIAIYKKSPDEIQLFIELLFRFVMSKINSQAAITEFIIFEEIEDYRAGNPKALASKLNSQIDFLRRQLGNDPQLAHSRLRDDPLANQCAAATNPHDRKLESSNSQHKPLSHGNHKDALNAPNYGAFASASNFELRDCRLYSAHNITIHQYPN